ncbi:hypothetical protein [Pyrolobus fumarii]|uniref:hypothetical protein n=1 Tax=Pyrolobus fumarii TaxID=54252 RepID=UPI00064EEF1D|nr:hypothetical protein [Pyrolobus fumarii]
MAPAGNLTHLYLNLTLPSGAQVQVYAVNISYTSGALINNITFDKAKRSILIYMEYDNTGTTDVPITLNVTFYLAISWYGNYSFIASYYSNATGVLTEVASKQFVLTVAEPLTLCGTEPLLEISTVRHVTRIIADDVSSFKALSMFLNSSVMPGGNRNDAWYNTTALNNVLLVVYGGYALNVLQSLSMLPSFSSSLGINTTEIVIPAVWLDGMTVGGLVLPVQGNFTSIILTDVNASKVYVNATVALVARRCGKSMSISMLNITASRYVFVYEVQVSSMLLNATGQTTFLLANTTITDKLAVTNVTGITYFTTLLYSSNVYADLVEYARYHVSYVGVALSKVVGGPQSNLTIDHAEFSNVTGVTVASKKFDGVVDQYLIGKDHVITVANADTVNFTVQGYMAYVYALNPANLGNLYIPVYLRSSFVNHARLIVTLGLGGNYNYSYNFTQDMFCYKFYYGDAYVIGTSVTLSVGGLSEHDAAICAPMSGYPALSLSSVSQGGDIAVYKLNITLPLMASGDTIVFNVTLPAGVYLAGFLVEEPSSLNVVQQVKYNFGPFSFINVTTVGTPRLTLLDRPLNVTLLIFTDPSITTPVTVDYSLGINMTSTTLSYKKVLDDSLSLPINTAGEAFTLRLVDAHHEYALGLILSGYTPYTVHTVATSRTVYHAYANTELSTLASRIVVVGAPSTGFKWDYLNLTSNVTLIGYYSPKFYLDKLNITTTFNMTGVYIEALYIDIDADAAPGIYITVRNGGFLYGTRMYLNVSLAVFEKAILVNTSDTGYMVVEKSKIVATGSEINASSITLEDSSFTIISSGVFIGNVSTVNSVFKLVAPTRYSANLANFIVVPSVPVLAKTIVLLDRGVEATTQIWSMNVRVKFPTQTTAAVAVSVLAPVGPMKVLQNVARGYRVVADILVAGATPGTIEVDFTLPPAICERPQLLNSILVFYYDEANGEWRPANVTMRIDRTRCVVSVFFTSTTVPSVSNFTGLPISLYAPAPLPVVGLSEFKKLNAILAGTEKGSIPIHLVAVLAAVTLASVIVLMRRYST